eukprot:TRINITY_DN57040_c0_g1_i1.p2 TRINITY_DN57040_c0_g1~~TRINITY_DN57040_c0_g1_i1.p2  ORF type:complete len:222 (-),score=6.34 TRINITY_DN57040_c0_g1_i1:128-793(-)
MIRMCNQLLHAWKLKQIVIFFVVSHERRCSCRLVQFPSFLNILVIIALDMAQGTSQGCLVRAQRINLCRRPLSLSRKTLPCVEYRLFHCRPTTNKRRLTCQVSSQMRQDVMQTDIEQLPDGYVNYETIIVLTPKLGTEERDKQLAKFQTFLEQEECINIRTMTRQRQRLAYPMKGEWEGIYILYTYAARRSTSPKVQKMLSTPEAGSEDVILRHMTFKKSD